MRKHFLILMLLTLLPLAGWAETITLTPYVITKEYGDADPTQTNGGVPEARFGVVGALPAGVDKDDIAAALSIVRVNSVAGTKAGEVPGTYVYTFPAQITISATNYDIVTTQNGTLNITKKTIATPFTYTKEFDNAKMGTVTITNANASAVSAIFTRPAWDTWAEIGLKLKAIGDDANAKDKGTYTNTVIAELTGSTKDYYVLPDEDHAGTLTISARNINGEEATTKMTITVNPASADQNTLTTVPTVTLKFNNSLTVNSEDYTIQWKDPSGNNIAAEATNFHNSGTYTVVVTAKASSNFTGSKNGTFKVNGNSLSGAVITLENHPAAFYTYHTDGSEIQPTIVGVSVNNITYNSSSTPKLTDEFVISYQNNINVGTATVTITGKETGHYFNQTKSLDFTINPYDLSDANDAVTIDNILGLTYNTKEQKPNPVVKIGGVMLDKDIVESEVVVGHNYTVAWSNNINKTTTGSKAVVSVTGTGNYTGTHTKAFDIAAKSLESLPNTDFTSYSGVQYNGTRYMPETTGKVKYTHTPAAGTTPAQSVTLVENQDYVVSYGSNTNAGNATVTYTGIGNYDGSKQLTFSITKKPLIITAQSYTINFGTPRPTPYEVTYDGLVAADLEADGVTPKAGVFSTPVEVTQCDYNTTHANPSTNAGVYSLVPSAAAASNYSINPLTGFVPGTLTINASLVTLKVKNKKVVYGTNEPVYTPVAESTDGTVTVAAANLGDFYDLEIIGDAGVSLATLTAGQSFTFTREMRTNKTVGTYNIKVAGPAVLAGGYNVTYQDGTLEIEKLKLRAVAADKAISWNGGEPSMAEGYNNINIAANISLKKYANNDAEGALEAFTPLAADYAGVANPQTVANIVSKIEWVNEDGNPYTSGWTKGQPGTIKVTLLADLSAYAANYDIAGIDGEVSYSDIPTALLALDGAADQFATLQEFDNVTYAQVKVKTGRSGAREIKAQKWNAYILPFATSVKEISKMDEIGYAVVNVIDEANSTAGHIKFKLWMGDIPANTPFCMKTLEDLAGDTELVFTDKTIEAPANASVEIPIGTTGTSFIGCYNSHDITSANTNETYCFNDGWYTASNVYPVNPFESYMKTTSSSNARLEITFEEADGSTTAISTIAAEGVAAKATGWYTLNGVKLESVPVEKGVYINNGKKVVIK